MPKELVLHLAALGAALFPLAGARRVAVGTRDLLLAGFLTASALSALFADNHWLAFRALGVSVSGALLFWTAREVARNGYGRALRLTLSAVVVVAVATALLQAYGVESSLFAERRAPGGTFGNRNFMAHFAAIGLPLLLLCATEARGRARWAGAAALAVVAMGLVLSRSRAAWLSVGITGAFLGVEALAVARLQLDPFWRKRARGLALAALLGAVGALALPNSLEWRSESPYLESLVGVANYREGSGRGRLIQYGNTLRMALANPVLGVGPGNWPVDYPRFTTPGDPAFDGDDFIPTNPWPSSDWIAMLSERGAPAVILIVTLGTILALSGWRRWRDGPRGVEGLPDLALVATVIAVLVVGAFDAVLLLPAPSFFVWTALGALSAEHPDPVVRVVELGERRHRGALRLVAGLGALFALHSLAQWGAMAVFQKARHGAQAAHAAWLDPGSYRIRMLLALDYVRRGRCEQALPHTRAARDLFPHNPAPRVLLRRCGGR